MARFLSPAWLDEVAGAARRAGVRTDQPVTVEQVVTGTPDGDVRYTVAAGPGGVAVRTGGGPADVVLTTDWDTAVALSRGQVGAQQAFVAGRLRPRGDLSALPRAAAALASLDAALAQVRSRTTYEA